MKKEKAITLISLVITIVVLIILSSIGIYLSLGNNGIFTRAKEAKEITNKQEATDIINLKITTAQMNKYAEEQRMPTLKELSLTLGEDSEIQYVTEQSRKQASTEYDVSSENPSSIYTKLNKYPYEFEINGQLQLASINGVKVIASQNAESILYERSNEDNTATNNLVLNDNINNYKSIKIYYRIIGNNYINETYINNSVVDSSITITYEGRNSKNNDFLEIISYHINITENKLLISNGADAVIYLKAPGDAWGRTTSNSLYIDKIIGYR